MLTISQSERMGVEECEHAKLLLTRADTTPYNWTHIQRIKILFKRRHCRSLEALVGRNIAQLANGPNQFFFYYYLIEPQMRFYPVAVVLQRDTTHKNTHITQNIIPRSNETDHTKLHKQMKRPLEEGLG
jgi:hypothetical protein